MKARLTLIHRRPTNAEQFMAEALRLAAKGGRDVSPNPMVGAVLVRNGRIVARGYHRQFGGAHAEVDCLSRYKGPLEETTLYVTLEPCSHFGKTPPCAALLASTPIAHYIVSMRDPNPLVAGNGIAQLRKAGKNVEVGVLRDEAELLNRKYLRAVARGRPYVHLKVAQTLDGRITLQGERGRWITGPESRRLVHAMRAQHDAVVVGATTVAVDNPSLNVRGISGRDPDVVVLDGRLRIQESARVFGVGGRRRVFVCTSIGACRKHPRKVERLSEKGVAVLALPARHGRIRVPDLLEHLHLEQIGSILVEGGGEVFQQFVDAECVDELSLFVAPRLSRGGLAAFGSTPDANGTLARSASSLEVRQVGRDILLHAVFD